MSFQKFNSQKIKQLEQLSSQYAPSSLRLI
jgi:hypothetical protein